MKNHNTKPLIFVDTNVILAYLQESQASSHLFSPEILGRVSLAANAIIFQELLFANKTRIHPELFDKIQKEVRILDFNLTKVDEYMPVAQAMRHRITHSNDVLILSSAADCDYLVTYDSRLKETSSYLSPNKPIVVTPEQLFSMLESLV